MQARTGEIYEGGELTKALLSLHNTESKEDFEKNLIPVEEEDMTSKQKKQKKVSLSDRRSKLGKKLTVYRHENMINRKDPCLCGSGKLFKYCCHHVKKSERTSNQ